MRDDPMMRHAFDVLLAEELGGARPTDLEESIIAAAGRRVVELPPSPKPSHELTEEGRERDVSRRLAGLAFAVAIGAASAAALLLAFDPPATSPSAERPALVGRVLTGDVEWRQRAATRGAAAGQQLRVHPAVGDRIHTAAKRYTKLELNRLGPLTCAPATILEVKNMEWKELAGGVAAGALVVSVVVGAVQWTGGGRTVSAGTGETLEMRPDGGVADELRGGDAALRDELAKARERISDLEVELARRPEPRPQPEPKPADVPPVAARFAPLLGNSAYDEALTKVSWKLVGEAVKNYLATHRKVLELMAAGEEITPILKAEEDRWEGQLFAEIGKVVTEGVDGTSITAKAHHPGIGMNLIASTLDSAGQSLTAEQRTSMTQLAERMMREDALRRARYTDDSFDLERLVDEAEMTGRFFGQARGLLGSDQERLLSLGRVADRTLSDPLGSGFLWSKIDRPVLAESRAELAGAVGRKYVSDLRLSGAQIEKLKPMVHAWSQSLPAVWLDVPMDGFDRSGSHSIRRMRAMAGPHLQLLRDIAAGLRLSPEQLKKLRSTRRVLIPFLKPK